MLDHRFPDRVTDTLREFKIDPPRLLIEVTERTLMDTTGSALRSLERLRDRWACGSESTTSAPATALWATCNASRWTSSRSTVPSPPSSPTATLKARATVEAITTLAHAHHLTVTAEGVETQAQLDDDHRPRLRPRPGIPHWAASPSSALAFASVQLQNCGTFTRTPQRLPACRASRTVVG